MSTSLVVLQRKGRIAHQKLYLRRLMGIMRKLKILLQEIYSILESLRTCHVENNIYSS